MRSSSSRRQAVEHVGIYGDAQDEVGFILTTGFEDLGEFALDFHAHGDGALYVAAAIAVMAFVMEGGLHAFGMALACHFHQAKLGDGQYVGLGFVFAQAFLDLVHDLVAVTALFHVDEINNDQSTHIAELELPTHFLGGFHVHAQDGATLIFAATFVAAGVYVNGDQSFGFVNNQRASAFEVDLAGEGGFELFGDAELVKDWLELRCSVAAFSWTAGRLFR